MSTTYDSTGLSARRLESLKSLGQDPRAPSGVGLQKRFNLNTGIWESSDFGLGKTFNLNTGGFENPDLGFSKQLNFDTNQFENSDLGLGNFNLETGEWGVDAAKRKPSLFDSPDTKNQFDWGLLASGLQAGAGLFSAYNGMQGNKIARDELDFMKGLTQANLANSAKTTNAEIERRHTYGRSLLTDEQRANSLTTADHLAKYGVQGTI